MIKLFITDIDGCLMEPFTTPDWNVLAGIKKLNEQSDHDSNIPPLTICTGRPMPYAEAVAQFLGVGLPIIFESAGVFKLDEYSISVNGTFDDEAEQQVRELKQWFRDEVIPSHDGMQTEFFKLMDAGLVHSRSEVIQQALPLVRQYVEQHYQNFEVHYTDVSINVIRKGNDKRSGIEKLCELQGVKPEEVAFIGDSSGDIPGLKIAGRAFAPVNAAAEVKSVAEVMPVESTEAVLKAYRLVITENRG